MFSIIKRNGIEVPFNKQKIINAVSKANNEVSENSQLSDSQIEKIADEIENECLRAETPLTVDSISDMVEIKIMKAGGYEVAQKYVRYRFKRDLLRKANTTDGTIFELINGTNEYWKDENSNKNATLVTTQRDYIAGITSTDIAKRFIFPENLVKAHEDGLIHIHDMDYMAQNALSNCSLINLEDMLQNGTAINNVKIEKPHRILTACTIATQIILGVSSSQYGGTTITLTHLAPFVRDSFNWYKKKYIDWGFDEEKASEFAKKDTKKEVSDAVQTFNYQTNSMTSTNGQAPFLSVFMYLNETNEYKDELAMLIEEFLKQRIQGFKNEKGVWVTPAFPKLLYVLEEDNIIPDGKYWYLTELAAKCSAKRMVPDYISEKIMKELKNGDVYPCMGCRSFLTVDRFTNAGLGNMANAENYKPGERKYYGRFNQGVVTINLPDVACASQGDIETFWKLLDERLEMCHKALRIRHERLLGTPSDVAPIIWQNGAFARLEKGERIDKLLYNGYSTISLGYTGLYEMCMRMTGKSHTDEEAKPFALSVMKYMNDKCSEWKRLENIDYSLYGTPMESTTYKFATKTRERYGTIKDVTDHNYQTNSYHVVVREPIDAFSKLAFESEFQKLSPGGAVSYVEVPNMQNNIPAVLTLLQFMYNNIMYAEINTKSDYCEECGYSGEMQIVEDENGKLTWKCPNCGNTNKETLTVCRRTCGYIGTNFWNQGRTQEIKERVLHL